MSASKRAKSIRLRLWTWSHRLSAAAFLALLVLGQQERFPWLKGSPTATRLLAIIPFVDPLAGLEVMAASRNVTVTLLVGVALTTLIAVVFGRVFCGWLCPVGLVLELGDRLRNWLHRRLARLRVKVPQFHVPKGLKYWLLLLFLGLSLVAGIPVFTSASPINIVVLSVLFLPLVGLIVIGLLIVLEHFSPRLFCRSICPLGALYSLLGRYAPLRIRVRTGCERMACQRCTQHCPMGIRVMEDYVLAGKPAVNDPECTRCGTCSDVCGAGVVKLGWARRVDRVRLES